MHKYLKQKFTWYNQWHEKWIHGPAHWVVFACAVVTATTFFNYVANSAPGSTIVETVVPTVHAAGQCENRTAISSSCTCGSATVSSGYCCYVTAANPVAQQTQCGYTEVSPHWNHILTFSVDYRYPPAGQEQIEADWNAKHWDAGVANPTNKLTLNPNFAGYLYRLDQTYFSDGYDPHSGLYAQLQSYATANGYDLEDAFLHFSENTVLNGFPGGNASFTCSGQKTLACRIKVYKWNTPRWQINPKSALARAFYAAEWERVTGSTYKGIFLDEHPYFVNGSSSIVSGGKILEYPGLKWTDASFGTQYNVDLVVFLQVQKSVWSAGKKLIPNAAEYSTGGQAMSQSMISDGAFFEFMLDPNRDRYHVGLMYTASDQLLAAGKMVIFATRQKYNADPVDYFPAGYTAGNSSTPGNRARLVELAMYYLGKDAANQFAYFNILGAWGLPYSQSWTGAQEVNIGTPIGGRVTLKTGVDANGQNYTVFARDFTNGYVVLRTKESYAYNTYNDTTSATATLPRTLVPVAADGTLGTNVTQVTLRNSEAAIFVDPTDAVAPAAVTDLQAD